MRLRAKIKNVTGATKHFRAHIEAGSVVKDEAMPAPACVEIAPADGAFYLLYMNARGECITNQLCTQLCTTRIFRIFSKLSDFRAPEQLAGQVSNSFVCGCYWQNYFLIWAVGY
jgi:hypothetical protein